MAWMQRCCSRVVKTLCTALLILALLAFQFHDPGQGTQIILPTEDGSSLPSFTPLNITWTSEKLLGDGRTPLFIGISQNWLMLYQCVLSYLAAGWPATEIYVVDNTGTFFSNEQKKFSIQNPSFIDYGELKRLHVNVIVAPTRLTFSQLQNFFLFEALQRNWTHYYWSHEDAVALSANIDGANRSLYQEVVEDTRKNLPEPREWAIRFYAYDRLALVCTKAFMTVGGFDTRIPYYPSDCDMYERLNMAGYRNPSPFIGHVYDVASTLRDLTVFQDLGSVGSPSYSTLNQTLSQMMKKKFGGNDRNTWQQWQSGQISDPFYYDPKGIRRSQEEMILLGRRIYKLKWGTKQCRLFDHGYRAVDAWRQRNSWFG